MTIFEFKINSKEHSALIQERLFDLGFKWGDGSKTVQYITASYLVIKYSYTTQSLCLLKSELPGYNQISLDDLYDNDFVEKYLTLAPNFKVGDWVVIQGYSDNYDGKALRIDKINSNEYAYFSPHKSSSDNFSIKKHKVRKATKQEIEKTLITEAKRRGFFDTNNHIKNTLEKEKDYTTPRPNKGFFRDHEIKYRYYETEDKLCCTSGLTAVDGQFCLNPTIYKNGVWAEVSNKPPKFFEWEVKAVNNHSDVKIGCRYFTTSFLRKVFEELGHFNDGITIGDLKQQLENILENE